MEAPSGNQGEVKSATGQPQREKSQRGPRQQRVRQDSETFQGNNGAPSSRQSGGQGQGQNGGSKGVYREQGKQGGYQGGYSNYGDNGTGNPRQSPRGYRKADTTERGGRGGKGKQFHARENRGKQEEQDESSKHNERYDNSGAIGVDAKPENPHLSHAIAESKRLQELIPTGLSAEVSKQIQRIKEIVPSVDAHVIYGVLQQCNFDEEATVSQIMEKPSQKVDGSARPLGAEGWNTIVKKNLPPSAARDNGYDKRRKQQQQQDQRNGHAHPSDQHHVKQEQQVNGAPPPAEVEPDPEVIVSSLAEAIELQLKMIQQQTQMLHAMQNELFTITTAGGNEELQAERETLKHREIKLEEELILVRQRMKEVEYSLHNKEEEKAQRLRTLASRSQTIGILKQVSSAPSAQQQNRTQ